MANNSNLSEAELKALAYFAVGVSSEGSVGGQDVSNKLSFAGNMREGKLHPVGNSGYSFGTLQTDIGQHPEVAPLLISSYQTWARSNHPDWILTSSQEIQTINDLGRDGHTIENDHGRPLDATVKSHLDAFLKSDGGITFVHDRDVTQVDHLLRTGDDHKDHGSAVQQLLATPLYKNSMPDDQAKLATVILKLENQSGHAYYPKIIKEINDGKLHNFDDVKHQVDAILPNKPGKPGKPSEPDYIESGMAHALKGTDALLELRNAAPQSSLRKSYENVIVDPLVNPAVVDHELGKPTLGSDYKIVKGQFLHANAIKDKQPTNSIGILRLGAQGDAVGVLQSELSALGYLKDAKGQPLAPDKDFGPKTEAAVRAFQHDHGLVQNGFGPKTQQAIHDDLHPLNPLPAVSAMSSLPAGTPDLDDPRNAFNPNNALYNKIQQRIPDASEQRLLQFTAACHSQGISDRNLTDVHFDQQKGVVSFGASQNFEARTVSVDVKNPSPQPAQSIQQIQQTDQLHVLVQRQAQQQRQHDEQPTPSASPLPSAEPHAHPAAVAPAASSWRQETAPTANQPFAPAQYAAPPAVAHTPTLSPPLDPPALRDFRHAEHPLNARYEMFRDALGERGFHQDRPTLNAAPAVRGYSAEQKDRLAAGFTAQVGADQRFNTEIQNFRKDGEMFLAFEHPQELGEHPLVLAIPETQNLARSPEQHAAAWRARELPEQHAVNTQRPDPRNVSPDYPGHLDHPRHAMFENARGALEAEYGRWGIQKGAEHLDRETMQVMTAARGNRMNDVGAIRLYKATPDSSGIGEHPRLAVYSTPEGPYRGHTANVAYVQSQTLQQAAAQFQAVDQQVTQQTQANQQSQAQINAMAAQGPMPGGGR